MPNEFSWVVLTALSLNLLVRLWLARRHLRHILAHRNSVPAAFRDSISLSAHQKAADYSCDKTRLGIASMLIDSLMLLWMTFGGGIAACQQLAANLFTGLPAELLSFGLAALLLGVAGLPATLYATFVIERRHGFGKMTLPLFLADLAKGTALGMVLGTPLLASMLWLMREGGSLFWLWLWLVWCGFSLLLAWAYPTWIAPRFNRFSPLGDAELAQRIQQLLTRCGFASDGVYVMDGSRRSSHGNAYFSGMGKSKRIVFFDTLLTQLDHDEIEAVLAHELGHFRHGHIRTRIMVTFAGTFLLFWLFSLLQSLPAIQYGLGISRPDHASALLLLLLCAPIFSFLLAPASSFLSRRHEYQADAFAARHSRAEWLVRALVKLYRDNASTLTPDPLHSAFYDSHPPASLRITHLQQGLHS